ncbi:protein DpdE [Propionibacteriaceae bacterium Y2011]
MTFPLSPGIGRVAEFDGAKARIEFFESAAEPVADVVWCDVADVRRVPLGEQTKVHFKDGNDRWRAGRVVGGDDDMGVYYVRVPNQHWDVDIAESRLRVRWEKAPRDPLQALLSGANESPRFRDAREPVRRALLAERAATASATGIMSSGVRIHAHQINAALRIIRDPVQRYLLADEVGMGKTIQAGLVMRQLLVDEPGRRIGVIVPDAMVAQWRSELLEKFYLDDFVNSAGELPFVILSHSASKQWKQLSGVDLLVVDEAHLLARTDGPTASPYADIAPIAHGAPRVLMLSATPFSRSSTTDLALLHLLDPQLFRWEDQDAFVELLSARHQLALAVFGLDEEPDPNNPELLELQFDEIGQLLPGDDTLRLAMERALGVMRAGGGDPEAVDLEALKSAIAVLRTHISETYRLHHRVIRNRRHVIEKQRLDDKGLLTPFEFTGRTRPKVARLNGEEVTAGASAIADWVARCSAAILDDELDPRPYGRALGVLVSRLGGPVRDLHDALDYRVNGKEAGLLPEEKSLLDLAPPLGFESRILVELGTASGTDGLELLAEAIARRCPPKQRAVIFCGRGVLAANLRDRLMGRPVPAYAHLEEQSEVQREEATDSWRRAGGMLVVDETGDVGRNFQEADLAFHVRLPWNPNSLEQRIGRVDRYGDHRTAQQYVIADSDPDGLLTAWVKVLSSGFGIFGESISTLQEAVDDLAEDLWTAALTEGIEGFLDRQTTIGEALRREKRRINELDALESSYGTHADGEAMAMAIAAYEEDSTGIEKAFTQLIEGAEGFRFARRPNMDGSVTFEHGLEEKPLLSPRLLGRINTVKEARTGFFDRWQLRPRGRLFRRGNPFIDGVETLLDLDDRGQAVAMWRLNQRGPNEPMTYFGFDFLIEADLGPMVDLLHGRSQVEPIARRRADAALAPQYQRVWIPAHTLVPVDDPGFASYLSLPYVKGRDVNLNFHRIPALHSLLGGENNLAPVAESCFSVAREHVEVVADVVQASQKAAEQVRRETEIVLAQSRARSMAAGLVTDPAALGAEVEMGRAIEAGVAKPVIRVTGVSCVVVSATSWADHV